MTATTPPLTPGGSGTYPLLPAYYGEFGGQYVAEGLLPALDQLEQAFVDAMADEEFMREYRGLLRDYLGRPTPLTQCRNLPLDGANARIFLKREDLVHGGAHKTNQVIGQALLAKKMGKTRVVAETGAGQHGTATALACALLDRDLHGHQRHGPPRTERLSHAVDGRGSHRRGIRCRHAERCGE